MTTLVVSRVDTQVPSYVADAMDRAHDTTQDAMAYLRQTPTSSPQARRCRAVAYHLHREALQQLDALEGVTLEREMSGTGEIVTLHVTRRVLVALRACLDGVWALARHWVAVEETLSPVLPLTRPVGSSLASRYAATSLRSWTRHLPWLQAAGLLLYSPGEHNRPSLVGLPAVLERGADEARAQLRRRLAQGFTIRSDDETARAGGWWRPICEAMLDEVADWRDRLQAFTARVDVWRARVAAAAQAKAEAILERLARRRPGAGPMAAAGARALKKNNPTESQSFSPTGYGHAGHRNGPRTLSESSGGATAPTGEKDAPEARSPSQRAPAAPERSPEAAAKSRSGAAPPNPHADQGGVQRSRYHDAFERMMRIGKPQQ